MESKRSHLIIYGNKDDLLCVDDSKSSFTDDKNPLVKNVTEEFK